MRIREAQVADGGAPARVAPMAVLGALCLMLALSLAAGACSLLELPASAPALVVAGVVALVETAAALRPSVLRGLNIGLLVCVVVLLVLRPGPLSDGLMLLANQAAQVSAAHQSYVYELFQVGLPDEAAAAALQVALAFACGALAAAVSFSVLAHVPGLLAGVFAAYALVQAYLGVTPAPVWSMAAVVLVLASLAAVYGAGGRGGAFAAGCVALAAALVVGAAFAAYPADFRAENPSVRQVNEQLRDAVAGGETLADLLADVLIGQRKPEQQDAVQDPAAGQAARPDTAQEARASQAQRAFALPWWLFALLLLLVLLVAFVAWVLWRRSRVRKACAAADAAAAVDARFAHLVLLLRCAGVSCGNVPYSAYVQPACERFGAVAGRAFEDALGVWQQARYSTEAPSASQCAAFEKDARTVQAAIREGCGALRTAWIHLRSYLPR